MSPIIELIRAQIARLPETERFDLYAELRAHFEPDAEDFFDRLTLSAEWEEEISSRLDDVKKSRVKLIPCGEVDREVDAFFSDHNLKRLKQPS